MAVRQTTGTVWHYHPVPPHPRVGVDVGVKTLPPSPRTEGRGKSGDGFSPAEATLLQSWEPSERYPGRRSQAGAKGLEWS